MVVKYVDKYCLDIEEEKAAYQKLINDPDIFVIKEKEVMGQGSRPIVYILVYWCKEEI